MTKTYVSNLDECMEQFGLYYQNYFAIPPAVSFLISLSCSCPLSFPHTVVSLLKLSWPTQIRLSLGSAKKASYVQWLQELISNFLHNDCIISSNSGRLAYISEAAGGCRSGRQLSSPEAPLTEIRERMKCTQSSRWCRLDQKLVLSFREFKIWNLLVDRNKCAVVFILEYILQLIYNVFIRPS